MLVCNWISGHFSFHPVIARQSVWVNDEWSGATFDQMFSLVVCWVFWEISNPTQLRMVQCGMGTVCRYVVGYQGTPLHYVDKGTAVAICGSAFCNYSLTGGPNSHLMWAPAAGLQTSAYHPRQSCLAFSEKVILQCQPTPLWYSYIWKLCWFCLGSWWPDLCKFSCWQTWSHSKQSTFEYYVITVDH